MFDLANVQVVNDTVTLLIKNSGTRPILNFTVRIKGSDGGATKQTEGSGLPVFSVQNFQINFDSIETGEVNEVGVMPMILHNGEIVVCTNNYAKKNYFGLINNDDGEGSEWYMKVGKDTGNGIDLCDWGCNSWIGMQPDPS